MSYLDIIKLCDFITCFNDSLGYNEIWSNGYTEYKLIWLGQAISTVPSTILKKEIDD